MRQALVLAHRWLGLATALFLALAGVTGSVLVWRDAIEARLLPELVLAPAPPGARPLDPLDLRQRVEHQRPEAQVLYLPLHLKDGRALTIYVQPRPGHAARADFDDEVFVDPYSGRILGQRRWGAIEQGLRNLMPFVFRLHYAVAAGEAGALFFGWVALAWTVDCFLALALTLPGARSRRPWWPRWRPAWGMRWRAGTFKLNFDLHRAGGLWTWPLLLVFAWSSVALNLPQVYGPAMAALLPHQEARRPARAAPEPGERLSWAQARAQGRLQARAEADRRGFQVLGEHSLALDEGRGLFVYDVRTSRDIQQDRGNTRLLLDARSGALLAIHLPSGAAAGDTVREWLVALHVASVFGLPYQLLVTALGLLIAGLGATGVVVWWTKRRARRQRRPAARGGPAA